jgi:hypothetical protein
MPELESDLLLVTETDEAESIAARLVLAASQLTDRLLLESMVAITEVKEKRAGKLDAIVALIAKKVLDLRLDQGSQAVFPTAALLMRNFKEPDRDESSVSNLEGSLFDLREKLFDTSSAGDAAAAMQTGILLGDRATHFTAGWYGSRHITSVMKKDELAKYGREMAKLGYSTAFDTAASHRNLSPSRIVEAIVPPIKRNFGNMVKILMSFTNQEGENVAKILN